MDYMDHCPQKAVKFNNSLTHSFIHPSVHPSICPSQNILTGDPLCSQAALHIALQWKYTVMLICSIVFWKWQVGWAQLAVGFSQIRFTTGMLRPNLPSCLGALTLSMCSRKSLILNRTLILPFKKTLLGCVPSAGLCFQNGGVQFCWDVCLVYCHGIREPIFHQSCAQS